MEWTQIQRFSLISDTTSLIHDGGKMLLNILLPCIEEELRDGEDICILWDAALTDSSPWAADPADIESSDLLAMGNECRWKVIDSQRYVPVGLGSSLEVSIVFVHPEDKPIPHQSEWTFEVSEASLNICISEPLKPMLELEIDQKGNAQDIGHAVLDYSVGSTTIIDGMQIGGSITAKDTGWRVIAVERHQPLMPSCSQFSAVHVGLCELRVPIVR